MFLGSRHHDENISAVLRASEREHIGCAQGITTRTNRLGSGHHNENISAVLRASQREHVGCAPGITTKTYRWAQGTTIDRPADVTFIVHEQLSHLGITQQQPKEPRQNNPKACIPLWREVPRCTRGTTADSKHFHGVHS